MKTFILLFSLLGSFSAFAEYSLCRAKCSFTHTPSETSITHELGEVAVDYRSFEKLADLKQRLKDACRAEIIRRDLHSTPSVSSSLTIYSRIENNKRLLDGRGAICQ